MGNKSTFEGMARHQHGYYLTSAFLDTILAQE